MKIDENNFYINTRGVFHYDETPYEKPDYVSDSGSKYWFYSNGVIRESDHWGDVASCKWSICEDMSFVLSMNGIVCGFIEWVDLCANN